MLSTAHLPDIEQRREPIELIGTVIGTAGTPAYVHLQLEVIRRMFGSSMPALIVNDGPLEYPLIDVVAEYGFATIDGFDKPLGHSVGDMRIFQRGMEWAKEQGIDVIAKFSRRFIPLVSWRHGLQVLASENPNVACFTRRHNDRAEGLFRTDAIALRVRKLDNEKTNSIVAESLTRDYVSVEPIFDSFAKMNGGWAAWDLLGESFYKPHSKAMQWRGLLPYHYGDLSRELGLPYTDDDFFKGKFMTEITKPVIVPDVKTGTLVADPASESA